MSLVPNGNLRLELWRSGPAPGAFYNFPDRQRETEVEPIPRTLTLNPTLTSSSIISFVFDKGVIMAGDLLGSYGSCARFDNCPRIVKVNEKIVLGASGDYADFQHVSELVKREVIKDENHGDDFAMKPNSLYCWLTRVMYYMRSKMNPLWLSLVIAGFQNDEPFLGHTDKLGTAYTDKVICTGYGLHLCSPMLRSFLEQNPSPNVNDAKAIIHKCMEVLFYRDARSYPKYQLAIVTKDNVAIYDSVHINQNWSTADL